MWTQHFRIKRYNANLMQGGFLVLAILPLIIFGLILSSGNSRILGLNPKQRTERNIQKILKFLQEPIENYLEVPSSLNDNIAQARIEALIEGVIRQYRQDVSGLSVYWIEEGKEPRCLSKQLDTRMLTPQLPYEALPDAWTIFTSNHITQHTIRRKGPYTIYIGLQLRMTRSARDRYFNLMLIWSCILFISLAVGSLSLLCSKQYLDASNAFMKRIQAAQNGLLVVNNPSNVKDYPPPWNAIHEALTICLETLHNRERFQKTQHDLKVQEWKERCAQLEITHTALSKTHEMAKNALSIKTEFLANISHEVRTPMNSILGFVQTLLQADHLPRHREMLEIIESSSKTLLRILNDLLDLSRLEAGTLQLHSQPFILRETFEEIVSFLGPSAHSKQIELILKLPNVLPIYVLGDSVRLKQILTNMVSNAIKFTTKGWVEIQLTFTSSHAPKELQIQVGIFDTGIGVSEADCKRIFQRFGQGADSNSMQSGSGLGLVICRKLAQSMSGEVGLCQKPHKRGSHFWFTARFHMLAPASSPPSLLSNFVNRNLVYIGDSRRNFKSLESLLLHENLNLFYGKHPDDPSIASNVSNSQQCCLLIDYPWKGSWSKLSKQLAYLGKKFPESKRLAVIPSGLIQDFQAHLDDLDCHGYLLKPFTHRKVSELLQQSQVFTSLAEKIDPKIGQISEKPEKVRPIFNCSVLAVDDNAANLKLIGSYLQSLSTQFWTCNNGLSALKIFKREQVDLVLLDIQMPNLNGIQTLHRLQKFEKFGTTPVMALTARALHDEQKMLKNQGFVDVLTKPISYAQIEQLLAYYSQFKPTSSGVVSPSPQLPAEEKTKTAPRIFNAYEALETVRQNKHLLIHLLNGFLEELGRASTVVPSVPSAENGRTLRQVGSFLHQLQGSAAYCGSRRLNTIIDNLLDALRGKNSVAIDKKIQCFHTVINQTTAEIKQYVAENTLAERSYTLTSVK